MSSRLPPAVLLVALCLGLTRAAPAWERRFDGTARQRDVATSVVVDQSGDVLAAGNVWSARSFMDILVVKMDGATGASRWQRRIDGSGRPRTYGANEDEDLAWALAVDPSGDALVAGTIAQSRLRGGFAVVKLAGASGRRRWRRFVGDAFADRALAVAADGAGDVFAAGSLSTPVTGTDFAVAKLGGGRGHVLWRYTLDGGATSTQEEAWGMALDGAGDAIAAGRVVNPGRFSDFTVVKLDGATGAPRWRVSVDGLAPSSDEHWVYDGDNDDAAMAVAVDAADDVLAVGYVRNRERTLDLIVMKLAGADGRELWRREILDRSPSWNGTLAVDRAGDLVVAAWDGNGYDVIKFSGATGVELWRQPTVYVHGVSADAGGDVIVAGAIDYDMAVVKHAGDTGAERWRQVIHGGSALVYDADLAESVVVDAAGDAIVGGTLQGRSPDFAVLKLRRADGARLP